MIYEYKNPSDHITFNAKNNKIAAACTIILGKGLAGCTNTKTGKDLDTMIFFSEDPTDQLQKMLGSSIFDFVKANEIEVADAFGSFAYVTTEERKDYDKKIKSFTDPEDLLKFKSEHERNGRTSLDRIVKHAWEYSEKRITEKA